MIDIGTETGKSYSVKSHSVTVNFCSGITSSSLTVAVADLSFSCSFRNILTSTVLELTVAVLKRSQQFLNL